MHYIANPIYDAVFKFMMEDEDVAKRFIGIIIGKDILELSLLPQEKTIIKDELPIRIQRLDFVAYIKESNGDVSKVLIELQKSNQFFHADVMRFRGYLAKQYTLDDLPIITIYLLGFVLDELLPASVKASKEYINLSTQVRIEHKNSFIEKLTHECYVIQIPLLKKPLRSKIDYLLSIFDQSKAMSKDKEGKKVLVYDSNVQDSDIQTIIKRLELANANEKVREKIEDEEYLEKAYQESLGRLEADMVVLKKDLQQKEKELEQEKQRAEQDKIKIIKNMLASGMSIPQIAQLTGFDEAFVKKHLSE